MAGRGRGAGPAGDSEAPGERVIPASRRPDGTLRKEVRIRAGYIPQDEVEKYVARGTRPRSSGPALPPGVDPEMLAANKKKSGSAKKNEKRKEKKATPAVSEGAQGAEALAGGVAGLSLQREGAAPPAAAGHAAVVGREGEDTGSPAVEKLEKQLRNIRKKIRQAEALQESVAAKGSPATAEEEEKIQRIPALKGEAEELEKQIATAK